MAQPKDRLDFIYNDQGQTYFLDNGVLVLSGTPVPLEDTPDQWQETEVNYRRSSDYYGIARFFTVPLTYVKAGAKIIRQLNWLKGFGTKLYHVINLLDKTYGGGWVSRFFFRAQLELTELEDDENGVTVPLVESGFAKALQAYQDTEFEIPLSDPNAIRILMDGVTFDFKVSYTILAGVFVPSFSSGSPAVLMAQTAREGPEVGLISRSQINASSNANDLLGLGFLTAGPEEVADVKFKGSVKVKSTIEDLGESQDFRLAVYVRYPDNTGGRYQTLVGPVTLTPQQEYTFDFDVTVTLPGTAEYFLQYETLTSGSTFRPLEFFETTMTVDFKYRYPPTYVKAFKPDYVGRFLVNKMMEKIGETRNFTSTFFDDVSPLSWQGLALTSGDGIRGTVADPDNGVSEPVLKISWRKYFKAYNTVLNIEADEFNGAVRIEPKAAAFGSTSIATIIDTRDFKKSWYKEYLYSRIAIGYPDVTIEDVNGKKEFNVTHRYTTGIAEDDNELNLICDVFASMYEAEFTRIVTEGQATANNRNDNRLFFLHTDNIVRDPGPDQYYQLYRRAYDSVQGLPNWQTAFNIELSPKRCLLRHGNFLRGCLWFQQPGSIVFESSDRNKDLITQIGSEVIEEKANVVIAELPAPLFLPIVLTFEGPIPKNMVTLMAQQPNQSLSFVHKEVTRKGTPIELTVKPANNPSMVVSLLAAPDTNLNGLT